MERVRVLIVDDEPPARERLRRLLAAAADLEVVGEAASGSEALVAIRSLGPDLVFLDVQMPDLDGFGVLRGLGELGEPLPAVVFVTAHDEHALRAFEVHALDYLLKPFDDERFAAALARVREEVRRDRLEGVCRRLTTLLAGDQPRPPKGPERERLAIRSAGRVVLVDIADIDWIEGAGSYARLHVGGRSHLLRESLGRLEERFGEAFARIHRSTLVRLSRVRELRPLGHGEQAVVLADGTELKLSRGYRGRLSALLGG